MRTSGQGARWEPPSRAICQLLARLIYIGSPRLSTAPPLETAGLSGEAPWLFHAFAMLNRCIRCFQLSFQPQLSDCFLFVMAPKAKAQSQKRAGQSERGKQKVQKLWQPSQPDVMPDLAEPHKYNLECISSLVCARDAILQHPVFQDILMAEPLEMRQGGHQARN